MYGEVGKLVIWIKKSAEHPAEVLLSWVANFPCNGETDGVLEFKFFFYFNESTAAAFGHLLNAEGGSPHQSFSCLYYFFIKKRNEKKNQIFPPFLSNLSVKRLMIIQRERPTSHIESNLFPIPFGFFSFASSRGQTLNRGLSEFQPSYI